MTTHTFFLAMILLLKYFISCFDHSARIKILDFPTKKGNKTIRDGLVAFLRHNIGSGVSSSGLDLKRSRF